MPRELREQDFLFLAFELATEPQVGGYFHLHLNCWWSVHEDRGVAFYNPINDRTGKRRHRGLGAPQCNTDSRIQEALRPTFCTGTRLIERVFVPVHLQDLID